MHFALLGPMRVHDGDHEVTVSSPKQRALLAGLLVTAGRTQETNRLIDMLWSDGISGSRDALQMQMVRLRRAVGDQIASRIITRTNGYLIDVEPDELDINRFTDLCEHGRRAAQAENWDQAIRLLQEARDLWSGSPLEDVPSERLQVEYAPHLLEMHLDAIELSIDAQLTIGDERNLIGQLQELVRNHPFREGFVGQLMLALHRSDRRADALATYRNARHRLVSELGIEPSARLQTLHQQILCGDEGAAVVAPARSPGQSLRVGSLPGAGTVPAQLPADIGDFTGRADYLWELDELLNPCRAPRGHSAITVVAVTGAGGVGKTTLAVHSGHRHREDFPDGQLYINLRGTSDQPVAPGDALGQFLRGLGLDWPAIPVETDERAALYRSMLSDRCVLVVLDDARDAAHVRPLIPGGSRNAVLITSRDRLVSLDAVERLHLGVLDENEARALFTRIVGDISTTAEPDATACVLSVCAGLPLAVRIAAAHLAAQPARTIGALAGLLTDMARRLDVLQADDRSVRASFQASYTALTRTVRVDGTDPMRVFRLLSLWDGPVISLPAAAAMSGLPESITEVCAETLVGAHLLDSPSPRHYQFHDLMHVYALEQAVSEETQADRHNALCRVFAWYLHTAERACSLIEPQRRSPSFPADSAVRPLVFKSRDEAVSWCDSERVNLISATRQQARQGFDDYAWRLPAVLAPYYNLRKLWTDWIATHRIGLESATRESDSFGQACILADLARAYTDRRKFDDAGDAYRRALRLFREVGDEQGVLRILANLASMYGERGQQMAALDASEEALRMSRDLGEERVEAIILGNMGFACAELGRFDEAVRNLHLALKIRRDRNDFYGQGFIHQNLGEVYRNLRRTEEAADHYRQSLEIRQRLGDRFGEATTLASLGQLFTAELRPAEAREYWTTALRIFRDLDAPEAAKIQLWLDDLSQPYDMADEVIGDPAGVPESGTRA
ncbi:MAG TPA: BTAD domain-containing putative transcriptional regulator [Streptosporangiaceae bacterium]|nr:BTAD domain-containing putative transcriptional regulator [Streptosporangiaceae bacterium]